MLIDHEEVIEFEGDTVITLGCLKTVVLKNLSLCQPFFASGIPPVFVASIPALKMTVVCTNTILGGSSQLGKW